MVTSIQNNKQDTHPQKHIYLSIYNDIELKMIIFLLIDKHDPL